ncbi:MAG: aminoacyl-tRNA hydrolase, partial [Lancefieldella rimae]
MMSAQRQTHHGPRRSSTPQAPRELLKSPALICGLGNPGEKYAHTRHNIGFAVIDALARRYDARYWKSEAGCLVTTIIVTDADVQRQEVLLAKPQDFMNTSGGPLSKLA